MMKGIYQWFLNILMNLKSGLKRKKGSNESATKDYKNSLTKTYKTDSKKLSNDFDVQKFVDDFVKAVQINKDNIQTIKKERKKQMLQNDGKIDVQVIKEIAAQVLTQEKTGKAINSQGLLKIKQDFKKVEEQILVIAQEKYTDADHITYDIQRFYDYLDGKRSIESLPMDLFKIHDVRGTVIAYMWVDPHGGNTVYPNVGAYNKRMN